MGLVDAPVDRCQGRSKDAEMTGGLLDLCVGRGDEPAHDQKAEACECCDDHFLAPSAELLGPSVPFQ